MVKKILTDKGLRSTAFRDEVLQIFLNSEFALSTEEVESNLREFDRITLYRTIKTFIENGILHEIAIPGETKKLAYCKDDCNKHDDQHNHQHVHFHCKLCNSVACIEPKKMPEIELPNFLMESIEIQIKGICQNCNSGYSSSSI